MKKILLLLIVFSASAALMGQQSPTANQQAVQQAVIKMFDALSDRDSVSLKKYCTTDITLYEYGLVWNMDTLIMKAITLNPSTDFKRTNALNFISTTTDKNTAWVTYYLNSVVTRDGQQSTVQWLETVALIKEKKRWKVKHLHSTLIRRS